MQHHQTRNKLEKIYDVCGVKRLKGDQTWFSSYSDKRSVMAYHIAAGVSVTVTHYCCQAYVILSATKWNKQ